MNQKLRREPAVSPEKRPLDWEGCRLAYLESIHIQNNALENLKIERADRLREIDRQLKVATSAGSGISLGHIA